MDRIDSKSQLLGNYLKKQRLSKNMTLIELADKTSISISHISRIEKGIDHSKKEIRPSLYVIEKITDALNLNLIDVLLDSRYIALHGIETEPMNLVILDFLSNNEIQKRYPISLDKLSKKEMDDICKTIQNVLEYSWLKYRNYK